MNMRLPFLGIWPTKNTLPKWVLFRIVCDAQSKKLLPIVAEEDKIEADMVVVDAEVVLLAAVVMVDNLDNRERTVEL
jgi:hypothetical protein